MNTHSEFAVKLYIFANQEKKKKSTSPIPLLLPSEEEGKVAH